MFVCVLVSYSKGKGRRQTKEKSTSQVIEVARDVRGLNKSWSLRGLPGGAGKTRHDSPNFLKVSQKNNLFGLLLLGVYIRNFLLRHA